jgi:hypothetical protein
MKNNTKSEELSDKVVRGLKLTKERLLASKKASGGTLVFMKDGKIVKVKASDL